MTKAEYAEYQQAVAGFFEREGIANLSSTSGESYFSWRRCRCCGTGLGGDREDANGFNPITQEIQSYEFICTDCICYAECGELDDMTMLEIENS